MTSKLIKAVAADSNVILSAVIGKAALKVFTHLDIEVITAKYNVDEVLEYIPHLAFNYGIDRRMLLTQLSMLPLVIREREYYNSKIDEAFEYLKGRDRDDIHLAALALKEGIPIWSNDKDFESIPKIKVYTTAVLLKMHGI